jgi:hypothetical protein
MDAVLLVVRRMTPRNGTAALLNSRQHLTPAVLSGVKSAAHSIDREA